MASCDPVRAFVSVFPVNARGEILLQLRDDRPELDGPGTWSTLGGVIEPGETAEECAQRELAEECGRQADTLVTVDVVERVRPDTGRRIRIHIFAAAVDWSLDDLILGEGQELGWWPASSLPRLRLNSLIVDEMLAFAASPLVKELAAAAPPSTDTAPPPLPRGFADQLGIRPGSLVLVTGATAGFAGRLRAALPAGARLTASPGREEQPDVTLWWPRGPVDVQRFVEQAARLVPDNILWVVLAGSAVTGLRRLWTAAAAMRFVYQGTAPFGDNEEGARFLRRRGTHREE